MSLLCDVCEFQERSIKVVLVKCLMNPEAETQTLTESLPLKTKMENSKVSKMPSDISLCFVLDSKRPV